MDVSVDKFGRRLMMACALLFWVFGLLYLLRAQPLLTATGISVDAIGLIDIHAIYGGFQLGFGVFLWWCATKNQTIEAGLMALLFCIGAIVLCRVGSALMLGELGVHRIALAFEIPVLLLTGVALHKRRRESGDLA